MKLITRECDIKTAFVNAEVTNNCERIHRIINAYKSRILSTSMNKLKQIPKYRECCDVVQWVVESNVFTCNCPFDIQFDFECRIENMQWLILCTIWSNYEQLCWVRCCWWANYLWHKSVFLFRQVFCFCQNISGLFERCLKPIGFFMRFGRYGVCYMHNLNADVILLK